MEWYNDIIRALYASGYTNLFYQGFNIVNIACLLLFSYFYAPKLGMKRIDGLLIPLIVYPIGYLFIYFLGWAATGFTQWGSNNIVKGFSFFPLFCLMAARILHREKAQVLDLAALNASLLQGVAHIACSIAGCCYGYPASHGLWNPLFACYLFPIQLLESAVSLCIFAFLLVYTKKKKYRSDGILYPLFLVLFGGTRFFLEFLRNNDKLFRGISELALWALLMVVVGSVWLYKRKEKKPATSPTNQKRRK